MPSKKIAGFTLVEALITVVIIGILTSIGMPIYSEYALRGKIPEATAELNSRRVKAMQHEDSNRTFQDVTGTPNPACISVTSGKNFDFNCDIQTKDTFRVVATGKSAMTGFKYTIDQNNAKTSTITRPGWTGNPICWAVKKDGSC